MSCQYHKGESSLREEEEMLNFLKREFLKYPPEYINQFRLKKVFILKDLQRLSDKEQGVDTFGFTPTVENLYIEAYSKLKNINQLVPWNEDVKLALIFHHELFHMADASDEITRFWDVDDDEWATLNPKGIDAYDPDVSLKNYTDRPVGFMEPYGLLSVRDEGYWKM